MPSLRLLVNAVNEETSVCRELEEEVSELKELYILESKGWALNYQRELADWKIYEKARVRMLLPLKSRSMYTTVCCFFFIESIK